jgi:hypothetical protein
MQFLIILGSGTFLLGLAFVIWIVLTKRRGYGPPNWPVVIGQVTSSSLVSLQRETPHGVDQTYTPLVHYTYTAAGESYQGGRRNLLSDHAATYQDPAAARRAIDDYPQGAAVKVYHNPANPRQAVLEIPKAVAHNTVLLYGVTCMVAGAIIIALGIVL